MGTSSLVRQLTHALNHLYDPDVLRRHPLADRLGMTRGPNPGSALREALIALIEDLRPGAGVPINSGAWRAYKVLHCRYVQQLDQEQTADQLGVSVRQVRREQSAAVAVLADELCRSYASSDLAESDAAPDAHLLNELSWLRKPESEALSRLGDVVEATLKLANPLATERGVRMEAVVPANLPPVAIHPAALRQAVVSALTSAIGRVPGGWVRCSASCTGGCPHLLIEARALKALLPATEATQASVESARALARMFGGSLEVQESTHSLALSMQLVAARTTDVLVVDDNADVAQLFQRYVAGTSYRMRHAEDVEAMSAAIRERMPQVVILDVMIPGVDGWEILGRLRQHPQGRHVPVVVCTVLPERDLALALGATGFLAKPVSQQALLEALRQAMDEESPTSH